MLPVIGLRKKSITLLLTLCVLFNFGGGISLMRLMACKGGSLKNGGSPSTISITMIPKDQMSTWDEKR